MTRIGLWPAGITLGAPGKPTVSLYGVMLDGYPELAREVLRRIPHVVEATPEARTGEGRRTRPAGRPNVSG